MVKGVTPVVATVLLITITVGAAGTVYQLTQSNIGSGPTDSQQNVINIDDSLSKERCYLDSGETKIVMRNTGDSSVNASGITLLVDNKIEENAETNPELVDPQETFEVDANRIVTDEEEITLTNGEFSTDLSCVEISISESCNQIKQKGNSRGDGYYYIQPGEGEPFRTHCEMNSNGGWTLIASYSDGSFFNDCSELGMQHGNSCSSVCSEFTDDGGDCDDPSEKSTQDNEIDRLNDKYIINESYSSAKDFKTSDFVSPAYFRLPFEKVKFTNNDSEFINYDFSSYQTGSMEEFYRREDARHLQLRIPSSDSNMNSNSINECDDFELAVQSADNDGGPVDYLSSNRKYVRFSAAKAGPAWDAGNNGGCHYDDNLGWWGNKKLGGQYSDNSEYIGWYVK